MGYEKILLECTPFVWLASHIMHVHCLVPQTNSETTRCDMLAFALVAPQSNSFTACCLCLCLWLLCLRVSIHCIMCVIALPWVLRIQSLSTVSALSQRTPVTQMLLFLD